MIERTFQNIPDGKLSESDNQAFLVSLGWSKGITWQELLLSKRVLIISEAGAGKTYECRSQAKRLWDDGKPAFFIELAQLSSNDLLSLFDDEEEERFNLWLISQFEEATFFLDSYDELKLSRGSFEQALKRLKKAINGQLHRTRIVITTRPIPFDEQIVREILPVPLVLSNESNASKEQAFVAMAMNKHQSRSAKKEEGIVDWRTVALMPLSDEQIIEFSKSQGVTEPEALLEDLQKRNAQEFARRPQDLIELCADWREHKRIRTHFEQVASSVRVKLQARDDRPEPAELSIDKAIEGASRLALAMLVTRQLTIRHNAASDSNEQESALNPSTLLSDWQPNERKALLERALFGFASYGRVRFHHRSVFEYLAAERLKTLVVSGRMPFRSLQRLLFINTKGKTIVRPSMRPIAGWLALSNNRIFELLRDHEPAVLLNEGDPESLTQQQRTQALYAYVNRYGKGGWRDLKVPTIQIQRFASPDLAEPINQLWKSGIENPEVRIILLTLISSGRIVGCAHISREVACNTNAFYTERIKAIDGLIAINDLSLQQISSDITLSGQIWSSELAKGIILRLFPKHLSIEQLCKALLWINEEKRTIGGLNWGLPRLISEAKLDKVSLEKLRDGLIELVSSGLQWKNTWESFPSDRPYLSNTLAATCVCGLEIEINKQWLSTSILALQLKDQDYSSDDSKQKLQEILKNLNAKDNAMLFWEDNSLLQKYFPTTDPWKRLFHITRYHRVVELRTERDLDWIKKTLGDERYTVPDRALMLEIALRLTPKEYSSELKTLVSDQPKFISQIDKNLLPRKLSKWERKTATRAEQQKRKEAKNRASWIQLRREILTHPDKAFSREQGWNTAWNLWQVMRRSNEEDGVSGWNRRFIEDQFDKATADKLRIILMEIWRKEKPTLPSERPENERNTIFLSWEFGLAAIYAEAEDPQWATKLTTKEAELAAKYASVELNRLPFWLESLVIGHRDAVDNTIGKELSWELEQNTDVRTYSMLLQEISHTTEPVIKLFIPRITNWLDANKDTPSNLTNLSKYAERLNQVVNVLLQYGNQDIHRYLLEVAQEQIRTSLPDELSFIWLPILMQLDPESGIDYLEQKLYPIQPSKYSLAVTWFGELFGDKHNSINLSVPSFNPYLLLRLLRLAYYHVKRDEDNEHEGTYSPDNRDDAERARNYILNTLLNSKGEGGWQAKIEMINDPLFAHFKDRILAVAEENWAQEIDSEILTENQVATLDKIGETPPSTNTAMFALLNDRLADLDDLLLSDKSPSEAWAGITEERVMRREIARELWHKANNLYTVDQEAVTADEKETDIRLRSTASDHEAIIELKLADGRTARDLRDTIYDQLVRKYMAAEHSRSGCLLITIAKNREWEHPDITDKKQLINLEELKMILCNEAKCVEEMMGNTISLVVHILDLRPRLSKEK